MNAQICSKLYRFNQQKVEIIKPHPTFNQALSLVVAKCTVAR